MNGAGGGDAYLSTGRALDLTNSSPFAQYVANGLVGVPGTTLWVSALLRKSANNNEQFSLMLHDSPNPWSGQYNYSDNRLALGYFGAYTEVNGQRYWGLRIGAPENTRRGVTVRSNAPLTLNAPAFLVLRIDYAPVTTLRLYVNPLPDGNATVITPALTLTTTNNLAFRSVAYYAGYGVNFSEIDELRIGGTYASVAPTSGPAPTVTPTSTSVVPTPAPTNTSTATLMYSPPNLW